MGPTHHGPTSFSLIRGAAGGSQQGSASSWSMSIGVAELATSPMRTPGLGLPWPLLLFFLPKANSADKLWQKKKNSNGVGLPSLNLYAKWRELSWAWRLGPSDPSTSDPRSDRTTPAEQQQQPTLMHTHIRRIASIGQQL